MKRILALVMTICMVFCVSAIPAFAQDISLVVDGQTKTPDVAPQIIDGRTMVPVRFIAELFGCEVSWDANTQTVIIITKNYKPQTNTANLTTEQTNAIKKAESYLKYSSFSREGLINQLEFEKFSTEASAFAVDYLNINWYEQAAKKAESYLKYSSFSKDGLINQLEFEGFTKEEACYGADKAYN